MKKAVCIVIRKAPDAKCSIERYFSISRKNDSTKWGFPGGKVEEDETNIQAIIREVHEEIGVLIKEEDAVEIFNDVCPGDVYYDVTTYLFTGDMDFSQTKAEEGYNLGYMTSCDLCDYTFSPFSDYNRKVFKALGEL